MDTFVIEGGRRLEGRIAVNGAKNAGLPLMAAALLTDQPVILRDIPPLADIRSMVRLLGELGCRRAEAEESARTITLQTIDPNASHARYELMRTMRAGICALGPMLARRGFARVSMPGGCSIGDRPVDLHLRGLAALGATIRLQGGDITAEVHDRNKRLRGARVFLGGPFGSTVLGTANIMSAACLARGTTLIESAACEPEIVDLARLLTAMGARIDSRETGSRRWFTGGVGWSGPERGLQTSL